MTHQFHFEYLSKEEFTSRKNLLKEIKDGKISGVVVKEFFTVPQANTMVKNFKDERFEKFQLPFNQGATYPTVFGHVYKQAQHRPDAIAAYYENSHQFYLDFEKNFGVDASSMLQQAFEAIAGGRPVKIPTGATGSGLYAFSTFRDLNTENGEMPLHHDLNYADFSPATYHHLHNIVGISNRFAFFAMLQKPEAGGELTIFDITRTETKNQIDDLQLESITGKILHIEKDIAHTSLNMETGDLLLFDAGNIWHRVEKVRGNIHRITFGGFICFTDNEDEIYYWS
ncbi:MAG: hypothetical protein U0T74_01500 [Chitinophagales bacterium]